MAAFFGNKTEKTEEQRIAEERLYKLERLAAELADKVGGIEQRCAQLEKRLEEAERQADSHENLAQTSSVCEAPTTEHKRRMSFYLPPPFTDGVFREVFDHDVHGKTVYQLTTTDGIHGSYIVNDTADAVAMALISVSQMLRPACKVESSKTAQPTSIVTLEEGEAVKVEDGWKIISKAVVRIE